MNLEISNETQEYDLEDVINIKHKIIKNKIYKSLTFENKEYTIENIDDVKKLLSNVADIIKNVVNTNISKFINTKYNNKKLDELYKLLEEISKNKGSSKDILEIANKIESIEKQIQNITDEEIDITLNYLKNIIDIFSVFQDILENRYYYEN